MGKDRLYNYELMVMKIITVIYFIISLLLIK